MKKFKTFLNIILYSYIIFHIAYTIYMFTQSILYGFIWLAISIIEIAILIFNRKFKFLKYLLTIILVLQTTLSIIIMCLGFNFNTNNADYVLVLGYQLNDNQMSETLEYRLEKTYNYAKKNENSILVLCGGITRENTVSEAEVMKTYLINKGIDENKIVTEDQSTDTIENIHNSLEYINKNSKIVVISSNYHVFRAKEICKSVGIDAKSIGSKAPILLLPNQLLFEKIGFIKLFLTK